jgi:hypothetical protein
MESRIRFCKEIGPIAAITGKISRRDRLDHAAASGNWGFLTDD